MSEQRLMDLREAPLTWPSALKPRGGNPPDKETFGNWWSRNNKRLSNLHPQIAEQWIYKHWGYTPYGAIPLDRLVWRIEEWTTEYFLEWVDLIFSSPHGSCEFDYSVFHAKRFEPGLTMDATGTWNIPPVVIETPNGVCADKGRLPNVRYWLIEGHQRWRCLRGFNAHGECALSHKVFVLGLLD